MQSCSKMSRLEEVETALLLDGIYQIYGNDLRGYERTALQRKLGAFLAASRFASLSSLQGSVLRDSALADALLGNLIDQGSFLLSDPPGFGRLREVAEPLLCSYANPKIWLAECTTSEDIYGLAIMLEEAGVYGRADLHATCSNQTLLAQAREGYFDLGRLEELEAAYVAGGGKADFSRYWKRQGKRGRFSKELQRNITWSEYSLATDTSFNEFQLIVCKNQLGNFGFELRNRALSLFGNSLASFGVLCTDPVEQLGYAPFSIHFKPISQRHGIYRWSGNGGTMPPFRLDRENIPA